MRIASIALASTIVATSSVGLPYALGQEYASSQGTAPEGVPPAMSFQTKPATLEFLIDRSKDAFLGRVIDISPKKVFASNARELETREIETREVTFLVEEVGKGELKPGAPFRVILSPNVDVPVAVGEELYWYLPKAGKSPWLSPLGIESGHFRVHTKDKVKYALNLKNNEGLWSSRPDGNLYQDKSFESTQLINAAMALERASAPVPMIQSYADQPNRSRPVPLDLLISATRSRSERPNR